MEIEANWMSLNPTSLGKREFLLFPGVMLSAVFVVFFSAAVFKVNIRWETTISIALSLLIGPWIFTLFMVGARKVLIGSAVSLLTLYLLEFVRFLLVDGNYSEFLEIHFIGSKRLTTALLAAGPIIFLAFLLICLIETVREGKSNSHSLPLLRETWKKFW